MAPTVWKVLSTRRKKKQQDPKYLEKSSSSPNLHSLSSPSEPLTPPPTPTITNIRSLASTKDSWDAYMACLSPPSPPTSPSPSPALRFFTLSHRRKVRHTDCVKDLMEVKFVLPPPSTIGDGMDVWEKVQFGVGFENVMESEVASTLYPSS
ncbi:uncharacterized protein VTP21DRAFT_5530 [Calcarisporiella thermophila]|uniref:uncharacterized protein n=1 Tax=Calcarisporiella thermophila TaxID=911321 RepID=UPI0037435282